ncbi:MAG TPA: hypothetical protein P5277_03935 [Candidatus Paceibacterota bacterium]|nr:hypothetical protein [Candidatus Paceibacterota bacterium]
MSYQYTSNSIKNSYPSIMKYFETLPKTEDGVMYSLSDSCEEDILIQFFIINSSQRDVLGNERPLLYSLIRELETACFNNDEKEIFNVLEKTRVYLKDYKDI